MSAGPLRDLTDWLQEQVQAIWDAFVEFIGDTLLNAVEMLLALFATLIEAIPMPEFVSQYGLGALLANLPPGVQWFLVQMKIPQGLAILAAGIAFRLLRKLITLGQW